VAVYDTMKGLILLCLGLLGRAVAVPPPPPWPPAGTRTLEDHDESPTVVLEPGSTITGLANVFGIDTFTGIPYAEPPIGNLRLKPPKKWTKPLGNWVAPLMAPSCPQMFFSDKQGPWISQVMGALANTPLFQDAFLIDEDCLTITVQRPTGIDKGAKLPVLFWIFGGGFQVINRIMTAWEFWLTMRQLGATSLYDASLLINQGQSMQMPFIFVAVNYRTGGFGFMPGREIHRDGSANIGLRDQRMGLEWVSDNIEAFGGDPERVVLWGESAGAISVFDQMGLYGGNNMYKGKRLFRGAIMNSGSIIPADPVDCPKAQSVYDMVVAVAGCDKVRDTLHCLRQLPYEKFLDAANSVPGILSYTSVALSYLPRPDGRVLTRSPEMLVMNGEYAAVPMIIGDQEDEGTIFALFQYNLSSTAEIVDYLQEYYFHGASEATVRGLVATYPDDPTQGSPFRTDIWNVIYPQFKRLAALLGDISFTLARRAFLDATNIVNPGVPSWSYLNSYDFGTPILGTFHAADVAEVFYGPLPSYPATATQTYYINFLYHLNPNNGSNLFTHWPAWARDRQLMNFHALGSELIPDNFRSQSYDFLWSNIGSLHF